MNTEGSCLDHVYQVPVCEALADAMFYFKIPNGLERCAPVVELATPTSHLTKVQGSNPGKDTVVLSSVADSASAREYTIRQKSAR